MTLHKNVGDLLRYGKAFVNLFEGFQDFRDKQMPTRNARSSTTLFASHPTYKERMDAIATLPRRQVATRPRR